MNPPVQESAAKAGPEVVWLGTAGFEIGAAGETFLIDPFLSRNPRARPVQGLAPEDLGPAKRIFISHGHFDHILDVPAIANRLKAKVHCHSTQAVSLLRDGLDPDLLEEIGRDGQRFDFGSFAARATYHDHIKFDLRLVLSTLAKINLRLPGLMPLSREYPHGQVLSWKFEAAGRSIRHFGSAGMSREELDVLAEEKTDVLLLPLQGHTRICEIGLEHVRILKPKTVIVHHQDDFFPPISREVDIKPFLTGMAREFPKTEVIVPRINEPFQL